jgi:hypothetical protein
MTLYELLHQVSFDEIVPFIKRYHGWNALALYKIHYDYLRHLTPELGERTTAVVSNGELDESWSEPHLDAHPSDILIFALCLLMGLSWASHGPLIDLSRRALSSRP